MGSRRCTLAGEAASVSAARRFVTGAVNELGRQDLEWSAVLIVSELATNVLLHARSATMTITVSTSGSGGVRLEVIDSSPAVPRMRSYTEQATTGRGMRLVQDQSSAWGVEQLPTGKYVWAELPSPIAKEPVAARTAQGDLLPGPELDLDVDALLARFDDESSRQSVPRTTRDLAQAGPELAGVGQ